jgi:hypothetical protein
VLLTALIFCAHYVCILNTRWVLLSICVSPVELYWRQSAYVYIITTKIDNFFLNVKMYVF